MGVRIYGRLRKGVGVSVPLSGVVKGWLVILAVPLYLLFGIKGAAVAVGAWLLFFGRRRR